MMWSRLHRRALLVAVLGGAADLGAQAPALPAGALMPGDRVRIHTAGSKDRITTVHALRGDTLLLQRGRTAEPWALPLASAISIDVSRGRRSRTVRGALVGLLAGGLLTGFITYAVYDPTADDLADFVSFKREGAALGAGLVGGVVGAVAGGLFGAHHPSERWERVHPPPRAGAAPRPRGGP